MQSNWLLAATDQRGSLSREATHPQPYRQEPRIGSRPDRRRDARARTHSWHGQRIGSPSKRLRAEVGLGLGLGLDFNRSSPLRPALARFGTPLDVFGSYDTSTC